MTPKKGEKSLLIEQFYSIYGTKMAPNFRRFVYLGCFLKKPAIMRGLICMPETGNTLDTFIKCLRRQKAKKKWGRVYISICQSYRDNKIQCRFVCNKVNNYGMYIFFRGGGQCWQSNEQNQFHWRGKYTVPPIWKFQKGKGCKM